MKLAVGAWAPPLLATLLLGTLALRPQATPRLPLTRQELTCTTPPTFRVGYESGEGALRLDGGRYRFQGVSWLEGDLCGPGILLVTADGEVAEKEAPVLQISLGAGSCCASHSPSAARSGWRCLRPDGSRWPT